jgi:hypothetical protein
MTSETNQTSLIANDAATSGSKVTTGAESNTASASSSSNAAMQSIAKKKVPLLYEYWKAPMVIEADLAAYHAISWLPGGVLSSTTNLKFPTIDKIVIVCFEFHLMAGLGLPPSKIFVSILKYLGCELVNLNPNAITALSCFRMLCECWLKIPPDISMFWYFYYPARYDKQVFSGIGLTLCHNHRKEYLNTTFRGYRKGASQKWFHIAIHSEPNGRTIISLHRRMRISGRNLG